MSDEYQLRPGFNVPYGNAFRYDDDMDAEILKTALASMDSGNFFWFGHGTSDRIQGNGKKSSITQILALELSDEEQDHAGIAKVGL